MNNHLGGEADLKNWKLRNKMIMILFFCFLVMTISVLLNLKNEKVKNEKTLEVLELNIRENYDMTIRNQIDTIIGVMDGIFQKAVDGKVTLEEANIESAEMLRWLKYGSFIIIFWFIFTFRIICDKYFKKPNKNFKNIKFSFMFFSFHNFC